MLINMLVGNWLSSENTIALLEEMNYGDENTLLEKSYLSKKNWNDVG